MFVTSVNAAASSSSTLVAASSNHNSAALFSTALLHPRLAVRPASFRSLKLSSDHIFPRSAESNRLYSFQAQASSSDESPSSLEVGELYSDLKEKWDALENKSTVILYGGGVVVAVWLASVGIAAIDSVPLLPGIMELVGIGYTSWFVYRYLLYESGRKELGTDIEVLTKLISSAIE